MKRRTLAIYLTLALSIVLGISTVTWREKRSMNKSVSEDLEKKIIIGATLASEDSEYLKLVSVYMKEAAQEKGVELILEYANWDAQVQSKQIDSFIEREVDAIILCPINAKSMLTPLKKVKKANIPVINLNMQVDAVSSQYIATYVGASSSEEAALAAQLFIDTLGEEGGEIAIIEGAPGSDAQIFRTQTFLEKLTAYPKIEIVSIENGNWNRNKAKLIMTDLMRKHPHLKGVFSHDSNMAMGVVEALEALEVDRNLYIVGISEKEEYLEALRQKRLYGIITQPPDYEGKYSVYCAIMAAQGITLRPWYKDPIQILTHENVDSFKMTME